MGEVSLSRRQSKPDKVLSLQDRSLEGQTVKNVLQRRSGEPKHIVPCNILEKS